MPTDKMVQVEPIALLPTPAGAAIFLSDGRKRIVFYIDPSIGFAIRQALAGEESPRPLTHDLFATTLQGLGAEVLHTAIVKMEGEVFFARLFIKAENEIMERKIIELDARPSDCIALAIRQQAPIFFRPEVWEALPDTSEALEALRQEETDHGGYDSGK